MKKLVHSVIWPAVAGNVLWAFLQVAADPSVVGTILWPRLASLLFIGVYLSIDWIKTENDTQINETYWRFDVPLAASIATFAIATQIGAPWAPVPLALAFAVATLGHCFGAWDTNGERSSCKARAAFAGINALGPGWNVLQRNSRPLVNADSSPPGRRVVLISSEQGRKEVTSVGQWCSIVAQFSFQVFAESVCRFCEKAIGFNTRFSKDNGYVRGSCFEDAIEQGPSTHTPNVHTTTTKVPSSHQQRLLLTN